MSYVTREQQLELRLRVLSWYPSLIITLSVDFESDVVDILKDGGCFLSGQDWLVLTRFQCR